VNQQQQQNTDYYNQSLDDLDVDDDEVNYGKTTPKNCTVVENGRVVVKALPTPTNRAD
jgi:hypothetical protein